MTSAMQISFFLHLWCLHVRDSSYRQPLVASLLWIRVNTPSTKKSLFGYERRKCQPVLTTLAPAVASAANLSEQP